MIETLAALAVLAVLVFILNIIPVFAPPTWMALALVGFNFPETNPWLIALTGALAAMIGRLTLAGLSHRLLRQRLLSAAQRENVDVIRQGLEQRPRLTSGGFLAYAFSPLPSNLLFIAYGLTGLPRRRVAAPFFIGRLCSYAFFIVSGQAAGRHFGDQLAGSWGYASAYFIISQLLILLALWLFTHIDWGKLKGRGGLGWIKRGSKPSGTKHNDD